MSCLAAKAVLGLGLGLLLRLDPALAPLGLGFADLAPPAATAVPFNGGSGFFINARGDFLAAHHVIGDCRHPVVQTPAGLLPARVIAASVDLDIAVARTGRPPPAWLAFAAGGRALLDGPLAVVAFRGCRGLASRSVADAVSTPLAAWWPHLTAISADAAIEGGNSGAPVVDAGGAVVGMLVARLAANSGSGLAVDAPSLLRFLDGARIAHSTAPPGLPLAPGLAAAVAAGATFPVACLF